MSASTHSLNAAISSYAASSWSLLYEYALPLFAVCGWILALCFVLLSFKISFSIHRERQHTVDYLEYSRRFSATHSVRRQQHSADSRRGPGHMAPGRGPREQSLLSEHSAVRPPPEPLPVEYTEHSAGIQTSNVQSASTSKHIIPRLIKLSMLCALCWTVRGVYLMALRIWADTDQTPFGLKKLSWESLFYCITEYPPSLGALVLMIWRPRRRGNGPQSDPSEQNYPSAKLPGY